MNGPDTPTGTRTDPLRLRLPPKLISPRLARSPGRSEPMLPALPTPCSQRARRPRATRLEKGGSSRRSFLAGSAAGLSSAWMASNWAGILAAQEHARRAAASGSPGRFEFFSPEQATEVESVAAQIIPTNDTPGAREAGAVYFIDRALTTFDRQQQDVYTQGLGNLKTKTQEVFPGATKRRRSSRKSGRIPSPGSSPTPNTAATATRSVGS